MTPDIWKFVFILCRVTGLVWAGPVTGSPLVPVSAKAVVCLVLSLIAYVAAPPPESYEITAVLGELCFGAAAGFAARMIVESLATAGGMWDIQAGLSMANLVDPASGLSASLLGTFGAMVGATVFVTAGGLDVLLAGLMASFEAFPPGGFIEISDVSSVAVRSVPAFFALVGSIALPVTVTLLLVDAALAVIGRTAPQFNIFSVGFVVRMAVLLVLLLTVLPHVLTVFTERALEWVGTVFPL